MKESGRKECERSNVMGKGRSSNTGGKRGGNKDGRGKQNTRKELFFSPSTPADACDSSVTQLTAGQAVRAVLQTPRGDPYVLEVVLDDLQPVDQLRQV
jgi:hypothetical protein